MTRPRSTAREMAILSAECLVVIETTPGGASAAILSRELGCARKTLERMLRRLVDGGRVKRLGPKHGAGVTWAPLPSKIPARCVRSVFEWYEAEERQTPNTIA